MFKLREIEKRDLKSINKWRNCKQLIDCLGAPFRYISAEIDEIWYENYQKNRQTTVRCSIVDEKDEIMGLISLTSIDAINKSAELHIMIGELSNHGKGLGTFAVKEILSHAFNNLNLNKVELSVLENNKKAIALYEKCGFQFEGVKRKSVYKNGEYFDLHLYSILRSEYYGEI